MKGRKILYWTAATIIVAAVFFGTQFSTSRIVGNDGHFHIRYSQLLWERGLPDRLPELRYTTWGENYRDYHLLFHVLSMPFAKISDLRFGEKLATATFATVAGIAFAAALFAFGVENWWLWLILFLGGSGGFLFRMELGRVQSLSLSLFLMATITCVKRKWCWFCVIAVINVWLYDSFWLLFPIAAAWTISERVVNKKLEWRAVASVVCGVTTGMIVNPYFPKNFTSYAFNFWRSVVSLEKIPIATEWYPPTFHSLLDQNWPLLTVIVLIILVATLFKGWLSIKLANPGRKVVLLFLFFMVLGFGMLWLRSRRFVEYAPPFLVIFLAVFWSGIENIIPKFWRRAAVIVIGMVAVAGVCAHIMVFSRENQPDKTYLCYLEAGKWIDKNVPRGSTVFLGDWDDFPPLYFQAPNVRYVAGMDPLFLKEYNRNMYQLFCDITEGKYKGHVATVISNEFDSSFIFANMAEEEFNNQLGKERGVFRTFDGGTCRVYALDPKRFSK